MQSKSAPHQSPSFRREEPSPLLAPREKTGERADFAVLGFYAFLSIIATWPLVLNFTTHVPGDVTDAPALTWNLWWVKFSLFNAQTNPLYTNHVFYPIGIDLVAYTLTLWNGFLALPIIFISNYVAANNFVVLFELTLAAYGMYLLSYDRLTRAQLDTRAAVLAGFLYGLGSYHLNYLSRGQPNIAANHWVPFYFFFLIRALESRRTIRFGTLAGIFFALSVWTELTYAAFLGLLTMIYLFLVIVLRTRKFPIHPPIQRALGGIAALGMISSVSLAPILSDIVHETQRYGDYWTVGLGRTQIFSADLFGFILPSSLNPVVGFLTRDLTFQTINWTFMGLMPIALSIYAVVRFRTARIWSWLAIIFATLMLGPFLQIGGHLTDIPLPFGVFAYVPFLKSNRYPFRLNSFLMLALGLLASYGLAAILSQPRWKFATLALVAFAFAEQLTVPMQLTDLRVPEIFNTIRADPGDFAVLDLPLGWRDSVRIQGAVDYRAHFWQSTHQKRLLDGNTSRNPSFKFQYFLEAPIINSIIALENGREVDELQRARDRQMAPAVMGFYDIRYINAFRGRTDPRVLEYVTSIFPATEIYRDEERIVYRVAPQTQESGALDQSNETASLYFDDGWGRPQRLEPYPFGSADGTPEGFGYRWAEQSDARLWLPLAQHEYEIKFKLRAVNPSQKISVSANGQWIQELRARDTWSDYTLRIPSAIARDGLDELRFSSSLTPVGAIRQDGYAIGDTGIVSPVDISVTAAGFDAGRFGGIFINGKNAIEGRRGYTLVALNPQTGAVERSDRFDTFADPNESRRLIQFVAGLPRGIIVAGAAVDDVSQNLTQEAVEALRELGVGSDLRFRFRVAHAFIGVKGAQAGQAVERVDARLPANVWAGKNAASDHVAFALGTVTWEMVK